MSCEFAPFISKSNDQQLEQSLLRLCPLHLIFQFMNDQIPPLKLKGYRQITVLGKGAHGCVYLVLQQQTGKTFALKKTKKDPQQLQIIAKVAEKFSDRCVTPIKEIIIDDDLYFKMQPADCDAWSYIQNKGPLSIFQTARLMKYLFELVFQFFKQGFVHHDIRPYNILTFGGNIKNAKLADFSLSMILNRYEEGVWEELKQRDLYMAFVTCCILMTKKKFRVKKFDIEEKERFRNSETFALAKKEFPPFDKLYNQVVNNSDYVLKSAIWNENFDWKRQIAFKSLQTKKATQARKAKKIAKERMCHVCSKLINFKNFSRHAKTHK